MNLYLPELTIGQVSKATGVSISTLRAWERRYGFDIATRLSSGHRRYTRRDVEAVRAVERERQAGTPLPIAIDRATSQTYGSRSSVFGVLRHALPDIAPAVMSKPSMVKLSRAVEDEIAVRATLPLLFAAFQDERFWRASEQRWRHLAQISSITVALASHRRARHDGQIWQVPLPSGDALLREWLVICDSPTFSVCLGAVELPEEKSRSFEALWTTEPAIVREAARVAAAIATGHRPALGRALGNRLQSSAVSGYDPIRATTSLTNRMVRYLTLS